jgi:hypothetical protein
MKEGERRGPASAQRARWGNEEEEERRVGGRQRVITITSVTGFRGQLCC